MCCLFSVSLLPSETKNLPRVGEIMLIAFGPPNARNQRFFFVHNVRQLPSPPGQMVLNLNAIDCRFDSVCI